MSPSAPRSDAVDRLLAPAGRYRALIRRRPEMPAALASAGIEVEWFAEHLRTLALCFAEPLLDRRRAATGPARPALDEVYGAQALSEEVDRTTAAVWDRNQTEYERLASDRIRQRRLRLRGARLARLAAAERRGIARRIARPADPIVAAIDTLGRTHGSAAWEAARVQLEQTWASAWDGMAFEVVGVWQDELTPRLARLERLRRGAPRWALGAALAFAATLALLGAVNLLL